MIAINPKNETIMNDFELLSVIDEYFIKDCERNLMGYDDGLDLKICNVSVTVESIWEDEKGYNVHCWCDEFEGDLEIISLSDENQRNIANYLKAHM